MSFCGEDLEASLVAVLGIVDGFESCPGASLGNVSGVVRLWFGDIKAVCEATLNAVRGTVLEAIGVVLLGVFDRSHLATGGASPPKTIIPEPILGSSIQVLIRNPP